MNAEPGKTRVLLKGLIILVGAAFVAVAIYLVSARVYQDIGFPLDDAWIHQVYARNLAWYRQWSFRPGTISAGSTSPLWTFLLSVGYFFPQTPAFTWTYALGLIGLILTGVFGERVFRKISTCKFTWLPWFGLFLVLEWHLVWAAASGMETIWMAGIYLAILYYCYGDMKSLLLAGFLTGISVWIRPDGLTMLGPVLFTGWLLARDGKERIRRVSFSLAAFLVPMAAYLLFNWRTGGSLWPNTFYAKQAEYAALTTLPWFTRLGQILSLPLVGAGLLLLPGFLFAVFQAARSRKWSVLAAVLWWFGYSAIYAARLPVTYQHGRYLIPAMPVYFLLGFLGTFEGLSALKAKSRLAWGVKKFSQILVATVLVAFFFLGANSYDRDVAIINTEMVATAKWIQANIPGDARLAVHDIGAIGYFCDNDILDLAGLISPDVIPIIRNEGALSVYLDEKGVNYLVTFPGWYPQLSRQGELVFQTQSSYSPQAGGENMAVYAWPDGVTP